MATALTSNEVLKKLNMSRSTFYYLLKNNLVSIPTTETGRYVWDDSVIDEITKALSIKAVDIIEDSLPKPKTTKINNRRYLGNKYKLLDFIRNTVTNECHRINTVADIFAGTGSVASAFADKKLITNDFLYFNYICHIAWFGSEKYDELKIEQLVQFYNDVIPTEENYMSEHFANTFFSLEDCRKIGFIRENIEIRFK